MTGKNPCRLCGTAADLQLSHVLPAFVFRWLRKTSATGHLRFGEQPNRRVQDGWKHHWLCCSCEQMIGESEKLFADRFFYPLVEGRADGLEYGPWLLRFCASVSWRVLLLHREMDAFEDYSREDYKLLGRADTVWRDYLLARRDELAEFRQHLFLASRIEKATSDTAANINRHVLRHVGVDVVRGDGRNLVYAKLPSLFLMGVLRDSRPDEWRGTVVDAEGGTIPLLQSAPDAFYDYVNAKASRAGDLLGSTSDRQKAKVLDAIESDPGRALNSDTQRAIEFDLDMDSRKDGA